MALTENVKIKLYWLEQSRSQRILWLLEELKLPYELEIFHRDKVTMLADPELKKIHALGKSPVISITSPGSSSPTVIAESGFIVEYLIDHFSNSSSLLPKKYQDGDREAEAETEQWMRYKYFLHYAEGSLMTIMMLGLFTSKIKNSPVPFFIKPITNIITSKIRSSFLDDNFKTHFTFLENQLATAPEGGKYLCGPNLTGADILMSFPLIAAKETSSALTNLTEKSYPKLYNYIQVLEKEPGYLKAVQKILDIEGKFSAVL